MIHGFPSIRVSHCFKLCDVETGDILEEGRNGASLQRCSRRFADAILIRKAQGRRPAAPLTLHIDRIDREKLVSRKKEEGESHC